MKFAGRVIGPLLALLLTMPAVLVPVSSDAADRTVSREIDRSDFPKRTKVKATMGGKGPWATYPGGKFKALGSDPEECRSDVQMLDYDEARQRYFSGHERGAPKNIFTATQIAVLHYPDTAAARAAVKRNATYAERCPDVTEWVCTDCDGVYRTWRTAVPAPRVGGRSTMWSFKEVGNLKASGYTVVAQRGNVVVRVTATRTNSNYRAARGYPKLISKKATLSLARLALNVATDGESSRP